MPAGHPPEFRRRAVELARLRSKPVSQIAADLGISDSCLRNWMRKADLDAGRRDDGLTSGFPGQRLVNKNAADQHKGAGQRWRRRGESNPLTGLRSPVPLPAKSLVSQGERSTRDSGKEQTGSEPIARPLRVALRALSGGCVGMSRNGQTLPAHTVQIVNGGWAAWADQRTVLSWRRDRHVGRVWLVIGFTCLVASGAYVSRTENHASWLRNNGVRTTGTVLSDPPDSLRCNQVAVPIRFFISGKAAVHNYFVNGCSGNGLRKGDAVEVMYDPAKPNDFVVNGRANEQPIGTFLSIYGLVAGAFFLVGACVRARRLHVVRGVLQRRTWQDQQVSVAPFRSGWTRGRLALQVTLYASSVPLVTQTGAISRISLTKHHNTDGGSANPQVLPIAREGSNWVVLGDKEGRLVLARPPRSSASQAQGQ